MGRPVCMWAAPSSSMISVPDAGLFPSGGLPAIAVNASIDFGGKAVGIGRERDLGQDPHHLPVTGDRVLAAAALAQPRDARRRLGRWRDAAIVGQQPEPQRSKFGSLRPPDAARDVADRVRAGRIAILRCVGERADAARIDHDGDDALHT